ncbi:hypothetical protein REPUB_Repub18cG0055500 [Reevesia pubescens]
MIRQLMDRIVKKREKYKKWKGILSSNIWIVIKKNFEIANRCSVRWNREDGYEIDLGEDRFKVNLDEKTCYCRRYTLSDIHCAHAICVVRDKKGNIEYYISSWYHNEIYMLAYGIAIGTMEGRKDWPKTDTKELILPLEIKKMSGRPKTSRKNDLNELRKVKAGQSK